MAHHGEHTLKPEDSQPLGRKAINACGLVFVGGIVLLVLALVIGSLYEGGVRRFAFAYLTAYSYALELTLGCLGFVILTHLFRAGWCATVRRIPEIGAANMPTLAVLSIPVLLIILIGNGTLYPWAVSADTFGHHGEAHAAESPEHPESPAGPETHEAAALRPDATGVEDATGPRITLASDTADRQLVQAETNESPALEGIEGTAGEQAPRGMGHGPADADAAMEGHPQTEAAHEGEGEAGHDEAAIDAGAMPLAYATTHAEMDTPQHREYLAMLNHLVPKKGVYLTWWFFTLRLLLAMLAWCLMGVWFWKLSVQQDTSHDPRLSRAREKWAAPGIVLYVITVTMVAFDLVMSIDPVFYSTIFGVYYFAGAMIGVLSVTILACRGLQSMGYLPSVTAEHYHDLGKLLFTFIFFWSYIAFAQYMLLWYGNLPEETYWWEFRGGITVADSANYGNWWSVVLLTLLFGKSVVPFAVLLSRHVKRHPIALPCVAAWMLLMQYVDVYWLIMPVYDSPGFHFPWMEILVVLGVMGIVVGSAVRIAARYSMMSVGDPRMPESLAHENM